jgi:hypothetical protein
MVEVVFNDSTKGAMKVAKNYKKENMIGGTAGYIGTPPSQKELEELFEGEALGGNSNEVIGISFSLDIGDISKGAISEERKKLIFEIHKSPFRNDDKEERSLANYWEENLASLRKLKDSARNGEHIRIWYSDAPYSICGFYFINSILKEYECKVTAIKLPKYQFEKNNTIISYSSWSEVAAGKLYKFLPLETEISKIEQQFIASEWEELQNQNTIIRAVINGKLTSVAEDFYDYFIRLNIPDGEFIMARLIGKVLGRHQLGVGDWWIAQRIRNMIANREFEVVSDNEFYYDKILKKANTQ